MDPFGGIALVVARFGARKIAAALLGSNEFGDVTEKVLTLLVAAEQSERRLVEIESKLSVLIDQPYNVAMGRGIDYMRRALLSGYTLAARQQDLERADVALVDAVHSSNTSLQRALAERLNVVVLFALGNIPGAADRLSQLDLTLGEAAATAAELFASPYALADSLVKNGKMGTRSLSQAFSSDTRALHAWSLVRESSKETMGAIGSLFADYKSLALVAGLKAEIAIPDPEPLILAGPGCRLHVSAKMGVPATVGGVTCLIEPLTDVRIDDRMVENPYQFSHPTAIVELNRRRNDPVVASIDATGRDGVRDSGPSLEGFRIFALQDKDFWATVAPGQRVRVRAEMYHPMGQYPKEVYVGAGGFVFNAAVGSVRFAS